MTSESQSTNPSPQSTILDRLKGVVKSLPGYATTIIAICLLGALGFVAYHVYSFISDFNDAVTILSDRYGINLWLSKAMALVMVGPLAWGLKQSFFGKNAAHYRIGTSAYAILYFLGMYFLSQNASFARSSGEVLQWYADTPEGIRYYDAPGFDTKYGIELKPVTAQFKVALARQELGQAPQAVSIEQIDSLQLFDPITGASKYWYSQDRNGRYSIFSSPGFDPKTQAPLRELTPDIAQSISASVLAAQQTAETEKHERQQQAAAQAGRDIAQRRIAETKSLYSCGSAGLPAIATKPDGAPQGSTAARLFLSALSESGRFETDFFNSKFMKGEGFYRAYGGDTGFLREAGAFNCARSITLSTISTNCTNSIPDVYSCSVELKYNVFDKTGSATSSGRKAGKGAGVSEQEAIENAIQIVANEVIVAIGK